MQQSTNCYAYRIMIMSCEYKGVGKWKVGWDEGVGGGFQYHQGSSICARDPQQYNLKWLLLGTVQR